MSVLHILMRSRLLLVVLAVIYAITHWSVAHFNRRIKSEQPSAISTMTEADTNQSIHDMARLINIRDLFAIIANGCLSFMQAIGLMYLIVFLLAVD